MKVLEILLGNAVEWNESDDDGSDVAMHGTVVGVGFAQPEGDFYFLVLCEGEHEGEFASVMADLCTAVDTEEDEEE